MTHFLCQKYFYPLPPWSISILAVFSVKTPASIISRNCFSLLEQLIIWSRAGFNPESERIKFKRRPHGNEEQTRAFVWQQKVVCYSEPEKDYTHLHITLAVTFAAEWGTYATATANSSEAILAICPVREVSGSCCCFCIWNQMYSQQHTLRANFYSAD